MRNKWLRIHLNFYYNHWSTKCNCFSDSKFYFSNFNSNKNCTPFCVFIIDSKSLNWYINVVFHSKSFKENKIFKRICIYDKK